MHDTPIPPETQYKTCTKCRIEKPVAEFSRDKKRRDGLQYKCKACNRAYYEANAERIAERDRKYYVANKEKINERNRNYAEANRERLAEASRKYYQANKELITEKQRKYNALNAERISEWKRAYERQYSRVHAARIAERKRRYHQANAERIAERARKYGRENPHVGRAAANRRRARKLAVGGSYTAADIRVLVKGQTDKHGILRCWWCAQSCGEKYHVDHRIPLAKGGTNDAGNLCIACPKCNLSKSSKLPGDFNGRLL